MLYKIVIVGAYFICGLVSAWLFYTQFNYYAPGLMFILVTIIIALMIEPAIKLKSITIYCVLSYLVYFAVFFLTISCGSVGALTGIFFSGIGAHAVPWLTNKFLVKVTYKSGWMFWMGALSFFANVLLLLEPFGQFIKPVYDINRSGNDLKFFDLNIRFAPAFLFWQLSVGTKLGLEMFKNRIRLHSSGV